MLPISQFQKSLKVLFTDIDDTLTDDGFLGAKAYGALWKLKDAGVHVVPVTGRPAGWCEMIVRQWPVSGVIGENGGFYFRHHHHKMHRYFFNNETQRLQNKEKLEIVKSEILSTIPGVQVASDQFCRMMDLAIDYSEDVVPVPQEQVLRIVQIFESYGAKAKVSSIHVNGWFGDYDKLSMALYFLQNEFAISKEEAKEVCGFCGDSPNDEPMFAYFPNSFGVGNLENFADQLKYPPTYLAENWGGHGFADIVDCILKGR